MTAARNGVADMTRVVSLRCVWVLIFLVVSQIISCNRQDPDTPQVVRVWCHQGQEAENLAVREMAKAFNRTHKHENIRVQVAFFPDYQYTEKLSGAAAAGDMPDAMDIDGPLLAQFVEAGLLQPLDPWFTDADRRDFIPTILQQGTINDKLYALGAFDSALVLYYDKAVFAKANVKPPEEGKSWRWERFLQVCRTLRSAGFVPVAMHMNETADEWYTYAFSPLIWSGGGALIGKEGKTVKGILNSPENVQTLKRWQMLFKENLAPTDPVNPDPFGSGKTAMDFSGHWIAPSHIKAKGDRLGAMLIPRIGEEVVVPCGSWCWGVSSTAKKPKSAARWVRWVTETEHGIVPIVKANGAIPARRSAFGEFPEYNQMPYRLFRKQLQTWARTRPRTPYYATLTQHFAAALRDIARGANVKQRLDVAANEIQRVITRSRQTGK